MKRTILALLIATILFHVPYRLVTLGVEMMVLQPGLTRISTSDEGYWVAQDLALRLSSTGWDLEFKHPLSMGNETAYGITYPGYHKIFIDSELHWTARAMVLAHEGGHTLQPYWMDRAQGECFAEAVAALVMRDGIREHARYMSSVRWACLGVLLSESSAIATAAATLTTN